MKVGKKAIVIILDGVGDRPIESLGAKTPLEAAKTPNFDALAREGICGLMDPVAPGVKVGTDVGTLALFGYDPRQVYCGRGPIEAAGVDLQVKEGDVALRANFATVTDEGRIVSRRAARIREGPHALAKALDGMVLSDGTRVIFRAATEHRAVLVLRGEGLSHMITPSDPGPAPDFRLEMAVGPRPREVRRGKNVLKMEPIAGQAGLAADGEFDRAAAERTARLVTEFSMKAREILTPHPVNVKRIEQGLLPANYILLRGAGKKSLMHSLTEQFNIKGACIAGESTVKGVARIAGFTVISDPAFTANLDTDVSKKARASLDALDEFDLVMMHLKGTDIASHDGNARRKMKFIEAVDAACDTLMEKTREYDGLCYALTGDHSTPCELGEHSADPVPVVICGPEVSTDDVGSYGERACASGVLGRISAREFLLSVLGAIGAARRSTSPVPDSGGR